MSKEPHFKVYDWCKGALVWAPHLNKGIFVELNESHSDTECNERLQAAMDHLSKKTESK